MTLHKRAACRKDGSPQTPPKGAVAGSHQNTKKKLYDHDPELYDRAAPAKPVPADPSPEASAPPDGDRPEWPGRYSRERPEGCVNATTVAAPDGSKIKLWVLCAGAWCIAACRRLGGEFWHAGVLLGFETWPQCVSGWEARITMPPRLGFAAFRQDITRIIRILRRRPGGFEFLARPHFKHGKLHIHFLIRAADSPSQAAFLAELRAAAGRVRPGAYGTRQLHVAKIVNLVGITTHLAELEHRQSPEPLPAAYTGQSHFASRDFFLRPLTELCKEAHRRKERKRKARHATRKAVRRLERQKLEEMVRDRHADEAADDDDDDDDVYDFDRDELVAVDAEDIAALRSTLRRDRKEEKRLSARMEAMRQEVSTETLTPEEWRLARSNLQAAATWIQAHPGRHALDYVVLCVEERLASERKERLRGERKARDAARRVACPLLPLMTLTPIPLKLVPPPPPPDAVLATRAYYQFECDRSRHHAEAAKALIGDCTLPDWVRFGFHRCQAERSIGYYDRDRRQLAAIDDLIARGDFARVLLEHPLPLHHCIALRLLGSWPSTPFV